MHKDKLIYKYFGVWLQDVPCFFESVCLVSIVMFHTRWCKYGVSCKFIARK